MLHRRPRALLLILATAAACDAPAANPDDCADLWRGENASDCRVRLALEAWDRSPTEGERAIEALPPERGEQAYAWMQVVETRCWSTALCERIVEPALAESCARRVPGPWLHAEGTEHCPTGITVCGSGGSRKPQVEEEQAAVVLADPPASAAYADDPKLTGAAGGAAAGDAGDVQRVVRGSKGRIETCVQNAMMCNDVAGRIGASWNVVAGKVESAAITTNTTGDAELGACIVKAVRSMRFDPGFSGTVDEYAWVVTGQ